MNLQINKLLTSILAGFLGSGVSITIFMLLKQFISNSSTLDLVMFLMLLLSFLFGFIIQFSLQNFFYSMIEPNNYKNLGNKFLVYLSSCIVLGVISVIFTVILLTQTDLIIYLMLNIFVTIGFIAQYQISEISFKDRLIGVYAITASVLLLNFFMLLMRNTDMNIKLILGLLSIVAVSTIIGVIEFISSIICKLLNNEPR